MEYGTKASIAALGYFFTTLICTHNYSLFVISIFFALFSLLAAFYFFCNSVHRLLQAGVVVQVRIVQAATDTSMGLRRCCETVCIIGDDVARQPTRDSTSNYMVCEPPPNLLDHFRLSFLLRFCYNTTYLFLL